MDASLLITIIGTFASVGGAGISIHQARKSKNAADEAKKVRAQLIDHRKTSELAQLQTVCKRAQKSMEKYGPASSPSSLAGISPQKDAEDVQEFILNLKENSSYFGFKKPNEADEFCETLSPILSEFSQSSDPRELKEVGTQVLTHLSSMTSIIKRQLDTKKEKTR